jgi:hypothetical protein
MVPAAGPSLPFAAANFNYMLYSKISFIVSSIPMLAFAEVSKYFIPFYEANYSALLLSTYLSSARSTLFPTRIFPTLAPAC